MKMINLDKDTLLFSLQQFNASIDYLKELVEEVAEQNKEESPFLTQTVESILMEALSSDVNHMFSSIIQNADNFPFPLEDGEEETPKQDDSLIQMTIDDFTK